MNLAGTPMQGSVCRHREAEELATPIESVVFISVVDEFDANVPLAPDAGAVNGTVTPTTGFEST